MSDDRQLLETMSPSETPVDQAISTPSSGNRVGLVTNSRRMHPFAVRLMHWTNAVTIFVMLGSGWKIYDDHVILPWLVFPDFLTIGRWAQHGLQWHFFGMWVLVANGLLYLTYGFYTGRYRRMLLPIHWPDLVRTIRDSIHFRLAHDDETQYNAVQKTLYIGVISTGIVIVVSGLGLWKPVQFAPLVGFLGGFQTVRLIHFICMSIILGFVLVHVALALLVPKTIVAMVFGGPIIRDDGRESSVDKIAAEAAH